MAGPEISYEILDAVSSAITEAQCLGREGPYGGYDYGHNEAFYGKAPDDGRYVVRDFRKFGSPTWGKWVHQTHDHDEHEQAYSRLTGRHIASMAIAAYLKAATRPLTAEIADLRAENERLQLDGIHTCHDECQRPTCVLRRQLDEAMEALEQIANHKPLYDYVMNIQDGNFDEPGSPYDRGRQAEANYLAGKARAILAKRKQP